MRSYFIHEKRGSIRHNKRGLVLQRSGGAIGEILHHRHQRENDPNIQMLRESLQKLTMKPKAAFRLPAGGALGKKSKYIRF